MRIALVGAALALLVVLPLPAAAASSAPQLTRAGLVVPMGGPYDFDAVQAGHPSVLLEGGVYKMWYFGWDASYLSQIGYATSADGRVWTKHGPVLAPTPFLDGNDLAYPSVVHTASGYWMWYNGFDGVTDRIYTATSPDGTNWTKRGLALDVGPSGSPDSYYVAYPDVLYTSGGYYMWYTGIDSPSPPNSVIMLATSPDGLNWTKLGVVLDRDPIGSPDGYNVFSCGVVYQNSEFRMMYTGQAASGGTSLIYATSPDGTHWTKVAVALLPAPPSEDTVWEPNILVLPDGSWNVYYVVRNDGYDLQIFLATGPAPATPSGTPPIPGWVQTFFGGSPILAAAVIMSAGAAAGAGLAWVAGRARGSARARPRGP